MNPRAGNGRGARLAREARAALEIVGDVTVVETQHAGDESRLAVQASLSGASALIVLGGDGTVSHAARGLVESGSTLPLAMLAAGSGNDFAKSTGLPVRDYAAMAQLIARGTLRRIDVGVIDGLPFVNAAGFGFDAEVVARTTAGGRRAGAVTYALMALGSVHSSPGFMAEINGARDRRLMLVFANGRHFGGVFTIAPHARIDDGQLDMIDLRDASTMKRFALFARAASGRLAAADGVHMSTLASATVSFASPPMFEADGELHSARDATVRVECRPHALCLVSA